MKKSMENFIKKSIAVVSNIDSIIEKRGVLSFIQDMPGSSRLTEAELNKSVGLCYYCARNLSWLSKINFEKDAGTLGISDFYSFRDSMCELNELVALMIEYYEMCLDGKLSFEKRRELESIRDRDKFMEIFRDEKVLLLDNSREDVLASPIKNIFGMNLYIEIGKKSVVSNGIRNVHIKETSEYKAFHENPSLETLMPLLQTGEVETFFKGCIAVEDYDVYSEIAEAEVKYRGADAHYCSLKLHLNKSKFDKVYKVCENGTFLILYSTIDIIDDEYYCEYMGMDIELSKTKFRNYSGLHKGMYSDRKGTYNFIVDVNVD